MEIGKLLTLEVFNMNEEDYQVEFLKQRLIGLRDEARSLFTGELLQAKNVPNSVRKEVVEIYDEHGGAEILNQITHIAVNHIIQWHQQWKKNPLCFDKPSRSKEPSHKASFLDQVLNKSKESDDLLEALPVKRIRKPDSSGTTNSVEAWNSLQPHDRLRCQYIKDLINHNRKQGGLGITDEVRDEVGILAHDIGDSRKVAMCLGLEESVVEKWRRYYDEMMKEIEY